MNRFALAAVLVGTALCGPSPVQGAQDALDGLTGSWNVGYVDGVLDRVEGYATVVRAPGSGAPEVTVVLRHPETGRRSVLRSRSASVENGELKLVLYGRSPSGPSPDLPRVRGGVLEHASPLEARPADKVVLRVPPGVELQARVEGGGAAAARIAAAVESESHEIRLVRVGGEAGILRWRWEYEVDPLRPSLQGRRVGELKPGGRVVGSEDWARLDGQGILTVEDRRPYAPIASGKDGAPAVETLLKIRGWDLPVDLASPIRFTFDDPLIEFVKVDASRPGAAGAERRTPDEMDVRVRLYPGLQGGAKPFDLSGRPGIWTFSAASSLPALSVVRAGVGDAVEPARSLCPGDRVRLELRFDDELLFDRRAVALESAGGLSPPLVLRRLPEGGYQSPWLTLFDPESAAVRPADGLVLPVSPGRPLTVWSADLEDPLEYGAVDILSPEALTRPTLLLRPEGRWPEGDATLTRLLKDEPFYVLMRVPSAMAKELGEEAVVDVSVLGKESRGRITVYARGGDPRARVAYYGSRDPVSLDGGQSGTIREAVQPKLALVEVGNGDRVAVSFRDARTEAVVFDGAMRRRLDVRSQQVGELGKGLSEVLKGMLPEDPDRPVVQAKLQMTRNAAAIASRPELMAYEVVSVLEAYLHLLQQPLEGQALPGGRMHPVFGVPMTGAEEMNALHQAIHVEAGRILRDSFRSLATGLTIGMYEFVASQTSVGGLYTVVTGWSVTGRKVNWLGRVLAGIDAYQNLSSNVMSTRWGVEVAVEDWAQKTTRAAEKRRLGQASKLPGAGVAAPPPLTRTEARVQLDRRLRELGLADSGPAREARELLLRHPEMPPDLALVAAVSDGGMPANVLIRPGGLSPEAVAGHLDEYFRSYIGVRDPVRRQRMVHRYLGPQAPPLPDTVRLPRGATDSAATTRLDGADFPPMSSSEVGRPRNLDANAELAVEQSFNLSERRHRGRHLMDDVFRDDVERTRRILEDRGVGPQEIEARLAAARTRHERLQSMADRVEAVVDWRRDADVAALKLFLNKGCSEAEALVGHLFLSHETAGVARMQAGLGLTREQLQAALERFLARTQGIEAPRRRELAAAWLNRP